MKRQLFKIVGYFAYGGAAICLVVSLIFLLNAVLQGVNSPDEKIKTPNTSLKEYVDSQKRSWLSATATAPAKPDKNAKQEEKGGKEFEGELIKIWRSITANLDQFATTTKQGFVNQEGLENYFLSSTKQLSPDEYLIFLKEFDVEANQLKERAEKISALKEKDPEYVIWNEFVEWFVDDYMAKYYAEKERIEEERIESIASKTKSFESLTAAGFTFLMFISLTVLLLLVQVEMNTRKTEN